MHTHEHMHVHTLNYLLENNDFFAAVRVRANEKSTGICAFFLAHLNPIELTFLSSALTKTSACMYLRLRIFFAKNLFCCFNVCGSYSALGVGRTAVDTKALNIFVGICARGCHLACRSASISWLGCICGICFAL